MYRLLFLIIAVSAETRYDILTTVKYNNTMGYLHMHIYPYKNNSYYIKAYVYDKDSRLCKFVEINKSIPYSVQPAYWLLVPFTMLSILQSYYIEKMNKISIYNYV